MARKWLRDDRRLAIYRQSLLICTYCGKFCLEPELDHVIPRAAGGDNSNNNIVVCCGRCNRMKADSTLEEFAALIGKDHSVLLARVNAAYKRNNAADRKHAKQQIAKYGNFGKAKKELIRMLIPVYRALTAPEPAVQGV